MYVNIGVISTVPHDFELKSLVDRALRKKKRPWGSGIVHIKRDDPCQDRIERLWRGQQFAGMRWHSSTKQLLSEVEFLILVGTKSQCEKALPQLKDFPGRIKIIHVD